MCGVCVTTLHGFVVVVLSFTSGSRALTGSSALMLPLLSHSFHRSVLFCWLLPQLLMDDGYCYLWKLQKTDQGETQTGEETDNGELYTGTLQQVLSRHASKTSSIEHLDCPPLFIHLTASIRSGRNNLPIGDMPVCLRKAEIMCYLLSP